MLYFEYKLEMQLTFSSLHMQTSHSKFSHKITGISITIAFKRGICIGKNTRNCKKGNSLYWVWLVLVMQTLFNSQKFNKLCSHIYLKITNENHLLRGIIKFQSLRFLVSYPLQQIGNNTTPQSGHWQENLIFLWINHT